eukprot:gene4114-2960_t
MAGSFEDWLNALGFFTRCTLFATVGLAALSSFGVLSPGYLILTKETWKSLQLWRPITAGLFFGNFSFQWLMSVGMLITYMNYNEVYDFKNDRGRFLYFLLWLFLLESLVGYAAGFMVTSFSLCTSLCWTFCRRNSAQPVSLFGFTFSAGMFPWALTGLHVLMGQSPVPDIVGIIVGHSLLFLFDVLPSAHPFWRRLAITPQWLRRLVEKDARPAFHRETHPSGVGFGSRARESDAPTRHNWGSRGRTLGSS